MRLLWLPQVGPKSSTIALIKDRRCKDAERGEAGMWRQAETGVMRPRAEERAHYTVKVCF